MWIGLTNTEKIIFKMRKQIRITDFLEVEPVSHEPTTGRTIKTAWIAEKLPWQTLQNELCLYPDWQDECNLLNSRLDLQSVSKLDSEPYRKMLVSNSASQWQGSVSRTSGPRTYATGFDTSGDFLIDMKIKELSILLYAPKRGRVNSRELYPIIFVIFREI